MLIVTHQAPDLDAISSVWLLTRFWAQKFSGSRVAFVSAGETITAPAAAALGYSMDQVVHVDTGQGEFDHHLPARAGREFCAAQLVYTHLLTIHPDLTNDQALKLMVEHILTIDHFGEVYWPEANHPRYQFMLHQIIKGMDATATHDDAYQVELGCRLLDFVYASMKQYTKACEKLKEGIEFTLKNKLQAFAIETSNDEVLSVAQKANYQLVIKKDKKNGYVRIKARPDAEIILEPLYQAIKKIDQVGTWYYHPSGKMLINGSRKSAKHQPTPLTLEQLIITIKEVY